MNLSNGRQFPQSSARTIIMPYVHPHKSIGKYHYQICTPLIVSHTLVNKIY